MKYIPVLSADEEVKQRRESVKLHLLKKFNPYQRGYWRIRGEDPNCDMGGPHHMPELCVVECTYGDAVDLAISMSGFWQWGAGGSIEEVVVQTPISVRERQKLQQELSDLERKASAIKKKLGIK